MNNEAALILRCDFLKLVASLNMSAIVTSSASLIDKECLRKKWAKEHRMKIALQIVRNAYLSFPIAQNHFTLYKKKQSAWLLLHRGFPFLRAEHHGRSEL
jgi:hypothetical protein